MEGAEKLMRVRDLVITQPDPAADDRTPESLRVEMTVEGLADGAVRRPGAGS
jgi:hypothetical protein